ncbi:MAG: hypothetical protein HRU20_05930 [Pseudomonadales bacterium]|nr:hypothetical protein [Pseudomonadales bacterium]
MKALMISPQSQADTQKRSNNSQLHFALINMALQLIPALFMLVLEGHLQQPFND